MEREVIRELVLCFSGWVASAAILYINFVMFFSLQEIDMSDVIELVRGLDSMLDHMRADYAKWSNLGDDPHGTRAKMTEEYCASLHYYMGKKYVKVTDGSSVKAFVVACDDDKKFAYGDILKPAGWKTPARNFRRGNVLDRTFDRVRWTGAL